MNKLFKRFSVFLLSWFPSIASAQQLGGTRTLLESAQKIITVIVIPLVFSLALLYFFYGVAKYIRSEGEGKDDGKRIMVWGVVALFVMSSIWGLVAFLRGELLGNSNPMNQAIPTIGGGNSVGNGLYPDGSN